MTTEKVLRMTKKEKQVINDLYMAVNAFVDEEASIKTFESVINDIIEGIYYNQSVTDIYKIKIITEEED